MMRRLAEETRACARPLEVLLVHDGEAPPRTWLEDCGMPPVWREVAAPGAGYYDLRNLGAARASGDILVFLDSDAIPDDGWLSGLLDPFDDPAVLVAAGCAYIEPDSLYSRAFALAWFFPLREEPKPRTPADGFFVNNVAFRRSTFLAHPFTPVPGTSRGACVALARELRDAGITIWKTTAAQVSHPPPHGGRHFVVRALAQGRDRLARERGWRATAVGSLVRLVRHCGGSLRAILRGRDRVGLSRAAVPGALAIAWTYYGLYFAGEVGTLLGVPAVRRVQI
jgi:GT2 family glycosyltransferase